MDVNKTIDGQPANEPTAVQLTAQPDVDYKALYESEKSKNIKLDKYNKDLKEKYQSKISDEDKWKEKEQENALKIEEIVKENKTYKATAKLSSFIQDESVLKQIVDLYVQGDVDACFDNISAYWKAKELEFTKKISEASMQNSPTPPAASGKSTKSWRDYSMEELNELKVSNPAEYDRILKSIK